MKRSRFSEEQIIAVLCEQEAGVSTADVCRKQGSAVPRSTHGGRSTWDGSSDAAS